MADEPEQSDPERLLAEALRAQAIRAPLTDPAGARPATPEPPPAGTPAGTPAEATNTESGLPTDRLLGLLSGTDHQHELLSGRFPEVSGPTVGTGHPATAGQFVPQPGPPPGYPSPAAQFGAPLPPRTPPSGTSRLPAVSTRPSVWWFLLLAVLLGLAAGVIAGLFTLF